MGWEITGVAFGLGALALMGPVIQTIRRHTEGSTAWWFVFIYGWMTGRLTLYLVEGRPVSFVAYTIYMALCLALGIMIGLAKDRIGRTERFILLVLGLVALGGLFWPYL